MGQAARTVALARYGHDRMVDAYLARYRDALRSVIRWLYTRANCAESLTSKRVNTPAR